MKRKHFFIIFITMLFILISTITVGGANWEIELTKEAKVIQTNEPVCYIGSTLYTDLGKAIDDATSRQTIYVIPGDVNTKCTLSGEHTLKSGANLVIPFDGETSDAVVTETTGSGYLASSGYPDKDPDKWRRAQVNFEKNSKLNISSGATLTVGACYGGVTPEGGTSGLYTEIVLGEGAKIENYGVIKCFGFIKEITPKKSQITSYSGSEIEETLSIYDWGGAGNALGRKMEGVFPFKQYDFINIQCPGRFNYGSNFTASWNVYGNVSGAYSGKVTLFSTSVDSLLIAKGSSSDYLEFYTKGNTTASYKNGTENGLLNHETEYKFHGNFEIGHLSVVIKMIINVSIDSKDYVLPIATNTKMELCDGSNMTSSYSVKFLMGTQLIIGNNATLTTNGDMAFYQSPTAISTNTSSYDYVGYLTKTPSVLINYGTLYLNKSFGGYIQPKSENSKVITGTNFTNNITTKESNSTTNSFGTSIDKSQIWEIKNISTIDSFYNVSKQKNVEFEKGNYITVNSNGNYYAGISSNESEEINADSWSSSIYANSKSNRYRVNLVRPYIIATSIDWTIDSSIVTIRKINETEVEIDASTQLGTFTLTAQLMNGTTKLGSPVSQSIEVISAGTPIADLSLSSVPSYFSKVGDYFTITPTISPSDATNKNLKYVSSNPNAVTVDENGNVKAVGNGSATITVSTTDSSNINRTLNVTVSGSRITELLVSSTSVSVKKGNSTKITIGNYASAGTISLSLDGSNATATYDGKGTITITGKSVSIFSTTTLTITSDNGVNGSEIKATVNISVTMF